MTMLLLHHQKVLVFMPPYSLKVHQESSFDIIAEDAMLIMGEDDIKVKLSAACGGQCANFAMPHLGPWYHTVSCYHAYNNQQFKQNVVETFTSYIYYENIYLV